MHEPKLEPSNPRTTLPVRVDGTDLPDVLEATESPQLRAFAPLCSVFRRFLKSRDLKYTQERADVLDAIIARDGSFEAEELLLDLRARGHDVSKATVYRCLLYTSPSPRDS